MWSRLQRAPLTWMGFNGSQVFSLALLSKNFGQKALAQPLIPIGIAAKRDSSGTDGHPCPDNKPIFGREGRGFTQALWRNFVTKLCSSLPRTDRRNVRWLHFAAP